MQSLLGVVPSGPHWLRPPLSLSPGLIDPVLTCPFRPSICSNTHKVPCSFIGLVPRFASALSSLILICRSSLPAPLQASSTAKSQRFVAPSLVLVSGVRTVAYAIFHRHILLLSLFFYSSVLYCIIPLVFLHLSISRLFKLSLSYHLFLASIRLSLNSSLVQTNFSVVLISLSISSLALIVVVYHAESYTSLSSPVLFLSLLTLRRLLLLVLRYGFAAWGEREVPR